MAATAIKDGYKGGSDNQVKVNVDGSINVVSQSEITSFSKLGFAFSIIISGTTVKANSTETPLLYIKNPTGNTKTLYIPTQLLAPSPSQSNWVNFNVYYNPTVTVNGTAVIPVNLLAGSSVVSTINVYYLPTVSANGTFVDLIPTAVANTDSASVSKQVLSPYYILPPGNSMLYTGTAKANNTPVIMIIDEFES